VGTRVQLARDNEKNVRGPNQIVTGRSTTISAYLDRKKKTEILCRGQSPAKILRGKGEGKGEKKEDEVRAWSRQSRVAEYQAGLHGIKWTVSQRERSSSSKKENKSVSLG